jgi:hypothetical protein
MASTSRGQPRLAATRERREALLILAAAERFVRSFLAGPENRGLPPLGSGQRMPDPAFDHPGAGAELWRIAGMKAYC